MNAEQIIWNQIGKQMVIFYLDVTALPRYIRELMQTII